VSTIIFRRSFCNSLAPLVRGGAIVVVTKLPHILIEQVVNIESD